MKALYTAQLASLNTRSREVRVTHCLALQRSLLQFVVAAGLEYLLDTDPESVDAALAAELLQPSDGTPISLLDSLLPAIRGTGWSSCALGWYETVPTGQTNSVDQPLVRQLTKWVAFRNDRFGHGVTDDVTWQMADTWFPALVAASLDVLSPLLPTIDSRGQLVLHSPRSTLQLKLLHLISGSAFVIRRIKKRGSVWRLAYQVLDVDKATEGFYEPPECPLLRCIERSSSRYTSRVVSISSTETWHPMVSLPARQTNVFAGRQHELHQLYDWFADTESRACLIYGEGGIGKTTLALEFLNGLLEAPPVPLAWTPDLIAFYSAKQTRWGAGGLEFIRGVSPMISEAVRLLANAVEDRLGREWYDDDPRKTIDRAASLLAEVGVTRDRALLVLDNTETLSRSQTDEASLGDLIRHLSKRLCRIVLTSRRRERVEAAPIQVLPMSDEEGEALLARLAEVYAAAPLKSAGEATLRRYNRKLAGRPLLLDVFARQASGRGASLEGALTSVLQTAGADLGRFLFEDAWQRIGAPERDVFLVLAQLPDPIDSQTVGWICAEAGIAHEVWLEAFEETRFGHIHDYGARYDLELMSDTRSFLAAQCQALDATRKAQVDRYRDRVTRRYDQYFRAQEDFVSDRVKEAFRTAAAKAAKIAVTAGRLDDAHLWYEEAIRVDPKNSALWDRYAWFMMMRMHDLDNAERLAKEACRLDGKSPEAVFTLGMVAARKGDVESADRALAIAAGLGKPRHLVDVQKARARVAAMQKGGVIDMERMIVETDRLLKQAESGAGRMEEYWNKHRQECLVTRKRLGELKKTLPDIGVVVTHKRS
jgi:tetratricopeptide (TPR) repeat protein